MGVQLARYRYASGESWMERSLQVYRAALANPAAIVHRSFPKGELLPGQRPMRALLSRIKRAIGLRPRQE
jgi:hypothetical protein